MTIFSFITYPRREYHVFKGGRGPVRQPTLVHRARGRLVSVSYTLPRSHKWPPQDKYHAFGGSGLIVGSLLSTSFLWRTLVTPSCRLRFLVFRQAAETVRLQLGLPHLITSLTDLLEETDVQLYLAGLVILGKVVNALNEHHVPL